MSEYRYILCTRPNIYRPGNKRDIYRIDEDGEINIRHVDGNWHETTNNPNIIIKALDIVELRENEIEMMSINI